jgi:hypothetical protein
MLQDSRQAGAKFEGIARDMVQSPLWGKLNAEELAIASAILPVVRAWDSGEDYLGLGELAGSHDLAAAISTVLYMKGLV